MSFSRARAQRNLLSVCLRDRHTHTHTRMLCGLLGLVGSKHARSHCITKHWRSNPQHRNTLAHQDTKSANHRASFPCVAGPPLRPITFDVTACHATTTEGGTVLCAAACVIACCVALNTPGPVVLALAGWKDQTNGFSRVRRQSCPAAYLPRILYWAGILRILTTGLPSGWSFASR